MLYDRKNGRRKQKRAPWRSAERVDRGVEDGIKGEMPEPGLRAIRHMLTRILTQLGLMEAYPYREIGYIFPCCLIYRDAHRIQTDSNAEKLSLDKSACLSVRGYRDIKGEWRMLYVEYKR